MIIQRDRYLNRLIERRENGSIKVISGIRRSGKSYLLFNLFADYLLKEGVPADRIIKVALDDEENEELLDRKVLGTYLRERIGDEGRYYIMLDEIQLVEHFDKLLNGLNRNPALDIYVTGSNSRFLSSDIVTEFRGRGDEVRVYPLSFAEYVSVYEGSQQQAWADYFTYGGMPLILSRKSDEAKARYLNTLFETVYLTDIIDRNGVRNAVALDSLVSILASAVGSLTNPKKLAATFKSKGVDNASDKTLGSYISFLQDAFLIEKAQRYDVKGKRYIDSPFKYYFTDVGLRNARLNFRQQEENHIMENIIYNELLVRGFNVDVGVVEHETRTAEGKHEIRRLEVDFVCNKGSQRYYIQSAFAIPNETKFNQEKNSLIRIDDSFKKIIIDKDTVKPWRTEEGILIIGLQDFLLDEHSLLR